MAIQIGTVGTGHTQLGEGPVWLAETGQLLWVDIYGQSIHRWTPGRANEEFQQWPTPELVSFVVPTETGGWLAGFKSGLHHLTPHNDGTLTATRHDSLDADEPTLRFNDATTDPSGNLWACTMDMNATRPIAALLHYDAALQKRVAMTPFYIANGPAFSPDGATLYVVETVGGPARVKGIYACIVRPNQALTNERLLIDWAGLNSLPDGVITDAAGNLWVGEWAGNVLRCFSPDGRLRQAIELPAYQPTKAVFGGPDLTTLYVTTATLGVDAATLERYPDTGRVLVIEGTGAVGWPQVSVRR